MKAFATGWGRELARLSGSRIDLVLMTSMPAILLGLMGAMISPGALRDSPVMIVDRDGGPIAREIGRTLDASPMLRVIAVTPDIGEALSAVRSERALAVLVVPRGVGSVDSGPVEILYEAQFLAAGSIVQSALRAGVGLVLARQAAGNVGLGGADAIHIPVRVTLVGNQTVSLGWYLGLLLGPAVIHLLFAVTTISSIGSIVSKTASSRPPDDPQSAAALLGRLTPHLLACWFWGLAWIIGLALLGDYRFIGSIWAVAAGLLFLSFATVAVGALLVAVIREVATALSAAVIITGSALAYSGASLPITGAPWYARLWSEILPLTHYIRLQMDVMIGAYARPILVEAAVLALYPLLAGAAGVWLILRAGNRP